jgi:hypothetical protein
MAGERLRGQQSPEMVRPARHVVRVVGRRDDVEQMPIEYSRVSWFGHEFGYIGVRYDGYVTVKNASMSCGK